MTPLCKLTLKEVQCFKARQAAAHVSSHTVRPEGAAALASGSPSGTAALRKKEFRSGPVARRCSKELYALALAQVCTALATRRCACRNIVVLAQCYVRTIDLSRSQVARLNKKRGILKAA